jgi:hypothetical protein
MITLLALTYADTSATATNTSTSNLRGHFFTLLLVNLTDSDLFAVFDDSNSVSAEIGTDVSSLCGRVENPTSYSSCRGAITSIKAACCYVSHSTEFKKCGAFLYKTQSNIIGIYKKVSISIDCSNSFMGLSLVMVLLALLF